MPISIRVRDDVSLNDLRQIARSSTVLKTPHIGNMSPNNLLAARCGFPILFVDTTMPGRDSNANPIHCIRGGVGRDLLLGTHDLGQTLTTHVSVTRRGMEAFGFQQGDWVGSGHLAQARRAFPDTRIETGMEYCTRHRDLLEDLMRATTNAHPGIWYRRIDRNGNITTNCKNGHVLANPNGINCWNDITDDVFLSPKGEGWVLPNLLSLLIDVVVQSHNDGPMIWFLSGPDMIKYLPTQAEALSALYDAVKKECGYVHEQVEIQLVPFTNFRFAVRRTQQETLERLLLAVERFPNQVRRITELAIQCGDLWYKTERMNHLSQHDLECADDLFVPETLASVPLSGVNDLWTVIRKRYLPKEYR